MSLIFRLIYVLIRSLFKPRLSPLAAKTAMDLRVLPNDIDVFGHMTNSRYLTIGDLGQTDIFLRNGMVKAGLKKNLILVVAEQNMTYRRSLRLFEKFTLHTEFSRWDEKNFYFTSTFYAGSKLVATGVTRCAARGKDGLVSPLEIFSLMGVDPSCANEVVA